jgi:hypothetical protein
MHSKPRVCLVFVDGSADFGGIKPLAVATRKGKGLSREKQSLKKKFTKAEVTMF